MEKLTQDLFQDPKLEEKKDSIAGLCASGGGMSLCKTINPPDWLSDLIP